MVKGKREVRQASYLLNEIGESLRTAFEADDEEEDAT